MCFHNSLTTEAKKLENRFKAELKNRYVYKPIFHANGFDFPKWSVITSPGIIDSMSWGLIPNWVKDSTKINEYRSKTLNARSETVFELPSFKTAIQSNRCLVLSDGFYEWMTYNKQKYPHYIQLKDNEPFAMAGIYDTWKNPQTGDLIQSFSILTCDANPLMARIHNEGKRMPVILTPENEHFWLNNSLTQNEILSFAKPYDENLMDAYTIAKLISTKGANTNVEEVRNKFLYSELEMRLF